MADRCPTNVYYEFHGMGAEVCPYPCQNKTEYGYCKTTGCINPKFDRTRTFTSYDPIEIARQYAPKFDKLIVDMVEVVRCKDCKHFAHDGMAVIQDTGYYCTRPNQQSCNLIPEDYCSYGKRKESDVYCDRNLCAQNEYNGIGCDECQQMRKGEVEE